ncbi:MAG: DUF4423 domain-containing protein [Bdellovibrio sp.]
MNIFQKGHYTDIIKDNLKLNSTIRGYQSRLAEAAGVHNSYLSRVVNGQVHLTPDQAALLCAFWKLNTDEADFFMAQVNLARAGTKELKAILKRQLDEIRKKHEDLTSRFVDAKMLEASGQGLYYSAWYYSAIHFLLMIPGYQTVEALSQRLHLPPALTDASLQTLVILGMAKAEGKKWSAVISNLHMSSSSPWAPIYHSCFRQRVAFKVHERSEDDLHFTGLYPMSKKDFLQVRASLQDSMEKVRAMALPSKEEELYCVCLDWFKI